ncbi:hypothetical protein GCM10009127_09510 [Alteraurantiacibacter aestuarii]|uniref:DUF2155 domain-containing protein n=1 Tax=Alteraurantiacibacter aestuarii TaxID=650004 RepID=A0A844ZNW2_9SPHN|nr:DUF2155 domain-containing protein [Alteraurantiacibacter aestuarii]MXO87339.1 DUF2155 domain-containing protein [Alteraurantiacibacter aestuarii]
MRLAAAVAVAGAGLLSLAACGSGAPEPEAEQTEIPEELAGSDLPPVEVDPGLGTPLEERVATIGLINKRNNISRDIEMKPGESRRIDDVIIRLAACERTAPWETPALTGAFVQVLVQEREEAGSDPEWKRIFSGWLYKEAPAVNVVEHPIYDVWVKDCAMSFPGEEDTPS